MSNTSEVETETDRDKAINEMALRLDIPREAAQTIIDAIIAASRDLKIKDEKAVAAMESMQQKLEKLMNNPKIPQYLAQTWCDAVNACLDVVEKETAKYLK